MSFAADIRRFAAKASNALTVIPREATIRVMEQATQTQPSSRVTGTFVVGKVPVDTGELIGTCEVRIDGKTVAVGKVAGPSSMPPDIRAALSRLQPEQIAELIFTAEHAPLVEYGTSRFEGRYFVRTAIVKWEQIVAEVAEAFT